MKTIEGYMDTFDEGYERAQSHYLPLLATEREKVRRLREGLAALADGVAGLPPLAAIEGVLTEHYQTARTLLAETGETNKNTQL